MYKVRKNISVLLCLCSCLMVCGILASCGRKDDLSASWEEEGLNAQENGQPVEESKNTDEPVIYVQILGAVKNPGVYEVSEGSRLFQVLKLAGGFTKEACQECVNQASIVTDEQQIYVYTQKEAEELRESGEAGFIGSQNPSGLTGSESLTGDGRVNINTAGKEQLMTLPGIGESKAECIVQYRENTGKFSSIEDIMKVDGIKEGVYNKIKEQITV